MSTSDQSISETFTGTATGSNILECKFGTATTPRYATIIGSGTFEGTIKIMSSAPDAGAFGLVQNGTFAITGSDGFSTTVMFADNEDLRIDCSAFTSGQLDVTARYR